MPDPSAAHRARNPCVAALLCLSSGLVVADEHVLQNPAARTHLDLGGEWHVIVDPYENGFYTHRYRERSDGYFRNEKPDSPSDLVEYDFDESRTLTVPGDWNSQAGDLFFYEGTIWYERDFRLEKRAGKRYLLHFGAVNYEALVYVNGEKVGAHEGGFTPFHFDVTSRVEDGDNFVVVKVDIRRERDNVPTMNTDWWNYGGITRPVRLVEVGDTYLADYRLELDPATGDRITGRVRLGGSEPSGDDAVTLRIPELGVERWYRPGAGGRAAIELAVRPERWSPAAPRLYDVELEYRGEIVRDRIGFRTVSTRGEDILLNGEPVFLRGISIHEEALSREGRAWSEADARATLARARELGVNFVRLAHYPHNEAMVRAADEFGLLVWSEIPVYWTILFEEPAVYRKAARQLGEMIGRDRNRASVILWSIANETPNRPARFEFLERLATAARRLDDSRLVTAAMDTQVADGGVHRIEDPLAAVVDVIGVNTYCGWYGGVPEECAGLRWESRYGKPVVISEFGAGALHGLHGAPGERWTEEYQVRVYENNLAMIDAMPFVRGVTPWILKDFRSPRRPLPEIQDYWNRKGLLSETGERKAAWYVLRDYYERISP